MGKIANRQSLALSERGQLSQPHSEVPRGENVKPNECQSRDSNRSTTNAGSARTKFCVFKGRYDRQRTLAIRIAAITVDSAITIARFRPSKRPCFLKSPAGKTLLRLSASPLRLSAPGGGGGNAKTLCSYLKLSIELKCFLGDRLCDLRESSTNKQTRFFYLAGPKCCLKNSILGANPIFGEAK